MSCFPGFVLDPFFEVGLMQNLVDHDTLSIERHLGLQVASLMHSSFLGPLGPQALV